MIDFNFILLSTQDLSSGPWPSMYPAKILNKILNFECTHMPPVKSSI